MLLAGGPFLLTGLVVSLAYPANRFTLPFMLGASLLAVASIGLFGLIKPKLQYALLALLIAFSIGKQFEVNIAYVRDWDVQHNLFWQMSWRIPALEKNTALVSNDLPVTYFSDNSLSGPLNWIYSPPGEMNHILYFISIRLNSGLPELKPGLPFEQNYLAKYFYGNTSQLVVFDFSPPACLRVLDPQIDGENRFIAPLLRDAAALSNTDMIRPGDSAALPASLFAPEPAHGWCYYFEKADLARQFDDWETVTRLGDEAFALSDYPNNPIERFVFIEGYAHTGDWARAVKLSRESYKVSKGYVGQPLCRLWERIEAETTPSAQRSEALAEVESMLACKP
jgi:hypothetical protein